MENRNDQLFTRIAELIGTPDFGQAQVAYFEKNCQTFTDDAENKLEYTPIFEAYVHIMEELIESRLKEEGFTDDEFDAFLLHFRDNFEQYKEKNPDAVDVLFGFIDFDKFKQQMLQAKKGVVDQTPEQAENAKIDVEGYDQQVFWKFYGEDMADPALKWRKSVDFKDVKSPTNGCTGTIFQRPNKKGGMDIVRINQHYKNMPLEAFLEMVDRDQQPDHVKVYEEIERLSADDKIMYMRSKIPFMAERETIMRMKREKRDDGSWVVTMRSMEEHPKVPVNPKYVRNEMLIVRWIKVNAENPQDLDVIGFSNVDMKGYFPSRLMNMAISSMMGKAVKMWYAKANKVKAEFEEAGKLPK